MFKYFLGFLITVTVFLAQEQDSIKTYNLEDILVQSGVVIEPEKIINIDAKRLDKIDAANIGEITKLIPSIKLQNNSQGQSLIYLRGAGKRQLLLMFEGSQLNIPWDYRVDLSMLPTEAVGSISVTKGIPSVVYGVNNMAGVLSINSKEYVEGKDTKRLNFAFGTGNYKKISGYWLGGKDNLSYLISAGYNEKDGFRLPGDFDKEDGNRSNTYSKSFNAFTKLKYKYAKNSNLTISTSYINAEKGIPYEFEISTQRFWQYPVWDRVSLNVNGSHSFSEIGLSSLTYAFSASKFDMEIDQFTDKTYTVLNEKEINEDYVYTGRLIYTHLFNNSILKLSFNGYNTSHKEINETSVGLFINDFNYSQNIYSFGAEYEYILNKFSVLLGASFDGVNTPESGNNPKRDDDSDYSFTSTFSYKFSDRLITQLNYGRKTRFPTLREAYSDGNGKYVLNNDLKPEVAHSTDLGVNFLGNKFSAEAYLFLTYLDKGIIRITLPQNQFIRINKDKIRTYGFELKSSVKLSSKFKVDFSLTTLSSFGQNDNGEYKDTLEYKPEIIAGINLDYSPCDKLNLVFETSYIGNEYGYQEGNVVIRELPDYLLLNLRLGYKLKLIKTSINAYIRVNNLSDKLYYTQWGLPEAGREFRVGVSIDV